MLSFDCSDPPLASTDRVKYAAVGDTVHLVCTATGDPPITFTWLSPEGIVTSGAVLVLSPVTKHFAAGNFSCQAKNTAIGTSSNATTSLVLVSGEDSQSVEKRMYRLKETIFCTFHFNRCKGEHIQ